ncbi:ABC transporter ATP-binding protein [Bacillus testis]|uniref:ABC transporter ATP-binding protein n=1 Tax=Bacillus testis TaxID=1622072 RepID=UPI00067F6FE6|nr:ABC transporter transmembrane domain-containing protein [Bacillus testis]
MFDVYGKLAWFFKENWKRYASAILLLCMVNLLDMVPPKLVGMTIDGIHQQELDAKTIAIYIALLAGIAVSVYIMGYYWQHNLYGGAFLLERKIRFSFMDHLLKMTPAFYEKNRTGDLMARATNDVKAIQLTAGFGILSFTDSIMFTGTILCMMGFTISWKLTLLSIIPLPLMAFLMQVYGKKLHTHFTAAQDSFGKLNDSVLESVAGVRVIRAYVRERQSEREFAEMAEDVFQKDLRVTRIDALFDPTINILVGISYLIGLGYGAKMVFHQQITLGDLVSFNVYLGMLIWPMFAIGELINIMQRGNASLDRVGKTLRYKADVSDPEGEAVYVPQPEDIHFQQVGFQYPSSSMVNLDGVNIHLKRGETLGLVGKTGSGKTTFIRQLLREYPLGQGVISISGRRLEDLKLENIRAWLGYVPQDPFLFSKSIHDNITFGKTDATEEELKRAIALADFRKDLDMLPEGLETMVGEKGVALSGGQKQRISIARALIKDPELLLLDDSLSAVDAKTEKNIIKNIQRERFGKTTIIATHRMSAVKHANIIAVIDDGRIVQAGSHDELYKLGGWYREQYDRQQIEEEMEGGG